MSDTTTPRDATVEVEGYLTERAADMIQAYQDQTIRDSANGLAGEIVGMVIERFVDSDYLTPRYPEKLPKTPRGRMLMDQFPLMLRQEAETILKVVDEVDAELSSAASQPVRDGIGEIELRTMLKRYATSVGTADAVSGLGDPKRAGKAFEVVASIENEIVAAFAARGATGSAGEETR